MNYFIKFLIVIPTLNSHKLLPRIINSIKKQTYTNWRVIFVDGGSHLEHIKFLNNLSKVDQRFSWISQNKKHKGIYGAMNQGFIAANKDEFILFWGSDDIASSSNVFNDLNNIFLNKYIKNKNILPHLFICKAQYFKNANNINGRYSYFNQKNKFFNQKEFRRKLFFGYSLPHQGTLFSPKSKLLQKNYSLNYELASDLDYFLKISNNNSLLTYCLDFKIVHIAEGGVSSQKTILRLKEVFNIYKEQFGIFLFIPFILRFLRRLISLIIKV